VTKLSVVAMFGDYKPGMVEHLLAHVDVVLVFRDASPAVQAWLAEQGYKETGYKGVYEHKDATDD
jgi:hypothetical protein